MSKQKTDPDSGQKLKSSEKNKASKSSMILEAERQKASVSRSQFPIVGIGASAGGLEALEELLNNMPAETGMAFVVVTHQHPGHTSLLPELLGRETRMPVVEVADGMKLEPNHVYVGTPDGYLVILHGTIHKMETEKSESPRLPIDNFFRSLAEDQKEQAIGIVLSGTGTDGTLGLKAVKGDSGMAMVQQPQSAKYAGMPSSAIATGLADYVLPPAAMPKQLVAYAEGPYLTGTAVAAEMPSIPAEPMQKIFLQLRSRTGHDFSAYKSNTIRRRIERRMNVHQIEKPNLYVRYLQENPHEIDILFKELLIGVTHFFRDKEAWTALAPPLEELLKNRSENYSLRAWVPGCSTGEEVFSLAILLRECMDKIECHHNVQIFGTDLDEEAIAAARSGRYPNGIAVDVSPKRLDRFFSHDQTTYRIRKEIREMAIFAQQNMITDPPFTKLDILSCRNLLIYLNTELQKKLLPIFHYALRPGGLLFLGNSETIGSFTDLFEPIDKRSKIFRRKESATAIRALPEIPAHPRMGDEGQTFFKTGRAAGKETRVSAIIERVLLGRFAPASLVVNDHGDIIYIHGRTGEYLEPSQGQPRNNVLEMAREGLQIELAAAIRQCLADDKEVHCKNIRINSKGEFFHIDLSVAKLHDPEPLRGLLLVTFRPTPPLITELADKRKSERKQTGDSDRVEELEREIRSRKESHQTTLEELETSNEELKSTNEELQSTNEELQSTNEELETSKEEMQSLNEELTTVNAELQSKVDDLSHANNDMQNLLNSTEIATLFLDNDLNIKRFTEQVKELVMLRETDIDRPISELASNLEHQDLTTDCREVLRTLEFREAEVRSKDGGWYLMRIRPYRTTDNVIDGLVITFVNIRQLKEAQQAGELRTYFESIVETVRQPLVVLNDEFRIESANRSFCNLFRLEPRKIVGTQMFTLNDGDWNIPELRELLDEIVCENRTFEDFKMDHQFHKIGRRILLLNARRLQRDQALPSMVLLAMEDVTQEYTK